MKTLFFALLVTIPAFGTSPETTLPSSPAERRIERAQTFLQKQPNRYQAYNDLALALMARARESGDSSYYQQAEQAIANSLRIDPGNFEGKKAHVALLLGERKYPEALQEATALNHNTPDDVLVWGYMADADAALGNYDAAEKAAQWMMNLRPGNTPAYLCGAALREDWGDIDGSLDWLGKALQETPPLETEEEAWILTRMAGLNRAAGKSDAADSLLQQALKVFPDYYLSLEELARVRMAQQRYTEAVDLIERRNQAFPSPGSRHLLAEALESAGQAQKARATFAQFEQETRSRIDQPDNANRELVLYEVDRAHQPAEALRIARLEMGRRHDVWTLDAYAWALHANGQDGDAGVQIGKALAVGTREATLFYHAGAIAAAQGDKAAAGRYFKQSLDLDPASEVVGRDQQALAQLSTVARVERAH
jgi:tetratricopeptide (TPR) repeat protein